MTHHRLVARGQEQWAHDCALYGEDVCAAFWQYCYLRRQALRLVRQAAACGRVVMIDHACNWVWATTPHTLGART